MIDGHLPAYLYESDIDQLALLLSKNNHGISWVTWAPSQQCGNHHVCVCAPPPCKSVSENRKPRMYGSSGIFTSKLVKLRKCSPFCLPCSEIDNADNTAQSWLLWSNKGAFCFSLTAHGMPVGNAEARNPINFGSAMGG